MSFNTDPSAADFEEQDEGENQETVQVVIEISGGDITQVIASAPTQVIVVNRDLNLSFNGPIQGEEAYTSIWVAEVDDDIVQAVCTEAQNNIDA